MSPATLALMQRINTLSGRGEHLVALDLLQRIPAADRNIAAVLKAEAGLASAVGDWITAEAAYARLAEFEPTGEDLVSLGTIRLQLGRSNEAVRAFELAAALNPGSPRVWVSLGVALQQTGRSADANVAYREAICLEAAAGARKWNIETALPIEIQPGRGAQLLSDNARRRPSIFLAPVPKSGSTWLHHVLLSNLDYLPTSCASEQFPDDLLHWRKLVEFKAGGFVARNHIPARPENLWLLKTFDIRPVVTVRDPREIIWSWFHHLSHASRRSEIYPVTIHAPPDEWFGASTEQKLDWVIEEDLPKFSSWISGWVDAAAEDPGILIVDYSELARDMPGAVRRVLSHQGIAATYLQLTDVPPGRETNFRSGRTEEWREAMTPAQRRLATSMIPDRLFERFGWRRQDDDLVSGI